LLVLQSLAGLFNQFEQSHDFRGGWFEEALIKLFGSKDLPEERFDIEMNTPAFDGSLAGA
jgi:hypothetical protein